MKSGQVLDLALIYRFSLCIKEDDIVEHLLGGPPGEGKLKDEVMKILPVQKQTTAGQRTRFKAFVAVGDGKGYVGLGWKTSAEVADAIKGAIKSAKMSLVPVRLGYWGSKIGRAHV